MSRLEIPEGYELVDIPLREVEFQAHTCILKKYPDGREIEFYEAAEDQFVIAYDEGKPVWARVSGYSVHRNVEVVIVNLSNGMQIISDHDPRAVFGKAPGHEDPARYFPDEAVRLGVRIPCLPPQGMRRWAEEENQYYPVIHDSLWSALAFKASLLEKKRLGGRIEAMEAGWVVSAIDYEPVPEGEFAWPTAVEAIYTGVKETGYDLTVPGYETFASADGVILSNTMSLHVPAMPEALEDAKNLLMPSKMLFSVRSRDKTLPLPKHEMTLGTADAQLRPSGNVFRFLNRQDALAAVGRGEVKLQDTIEIENE